VPTGISNDVMGAIPQHPFFQRVMESLQGADRSWVLPYITIMASTGPLFLSVIWKKWIGEHAHLDPDGWVGRVRVLMPSEYDKHPWSFFRIYKGDSWHGNDAKLIFWMGRNWLLLTVLGFLLGGAVAVAVWCIYSRLVAMGATRKRRVTLPTAGGSGGVGSVGGSPRVSPFRFPPLRMPLWRKWSGTGVSKKQDYELVAQHDA